MYVLASLVNLRRGVEVLVLTHCRFVHPASWERPSPSSLKNQSVTETAARRLFRQRFIDEERHRRGPNAELKHSKARWLKGFAEQTPLERHVGRSLGLS